MKNLKRLGVSVTLMCVLAVAAFAGEVNSPPCAPPEPGILNTPPCDAASNAGDAASVTEVAIDLLQSALLLF